MVLTLVAERRERSGEALINKADTVGLAYATTQTLKSAELGATCPVDSDE